MTDKTDREIMQQALYALDSKHDMTKAEWLYLQYRAFNDLRERLAQPKREWQGLTDEESNRLVMEHLGPHALTGEKMSVYDAFLLAIRATEAKLKEKNT